MNTLYHFAILLPILASLAWFSTILSLLLLWQVADNHSSYERGTSVVLISDVGAEHRLAFIVGCSLTFVFYSLTLVGERVLRFGGVLPGRSLASNGDDEGVGGGSGKRGGIWRWDLGMAGLVFGIIGGIGLIILSVLDINTNQIGHWAGLVIFVLAAVVSASCQTAMVARLRKNNPEVAHLKRTKYLKISVILFTLALAICFIALMATGSCSRKDTEFEAVSPRCNSLRSAAAVCEWVASLFFDFYLMTFIMDYYPVTRSARKRRNGNDSLGDETFVYTSELGQLQQEDRPMSEAHTLDRAFSTTPGPVPTSSGRVSSSTNPYHGSPLPPSHEQL